MFDFDNIFYVLIYFSLVLFFIPCLNYIVRFTVFIIPYSKKYDIMADDLNKTNVSRYIIILINFAILFFITYLGSIYNKIFPLIAVFIYTFLAIIYINKYKKYNIVNYINEFSEDLFNWYKIYDLDIPEELKRECFKIHNKDYENFSKA